MCAKWNETIFKPEVLTTFIDSLKTFDESGEYKGFKIFNFYDYLTVLDSTLEFNKQIPDGEKRMLVLRAVRSIAAKNTITKDILLKAATKEESNYLSKPKQNFVIATSLSINYFEELRNAVINGIPITFSPFLPKQFEQKPMLKLQQQLQIEETPKTYTSARISVTARNTSEAYDIGMDALDLLRGIWNLILNGRGFTSFSTNARTKPINKVTLGSFHTIHFPNGKLVTDNTIWHELEYKRNDYKKDYQWEKAKEYETFARKHLSKHPYKSEVEDLIRRYARALDYRNMQISFIELWGILEKATATLNANHKMTVARAAFLYDKPDLHKQVLNHLRIYRNSSVHTGQRTEQIERLVFQAARYVEDLIFFHVENFFKFSSLNEAAAFLDLPSEAAELRKHFKLLQKAIRFHR